MTNEQILEQQVEALEKLLQLKQAIIEELESKVQKQQNNNQPQWQPYYPWYPNHSYGTISVGGSGDTSVQAPGYIAPIQTGSVNGSSQIVSNMFPLSQDAIQK
jgi:hypothetical protein